MATALSKIIVPSPRLAETLDWKKGCTILAMRLSEATLHLSAADLSRPDDPPVPLPPLDCRGALLGSPPRPPEWRPFTRAVPTSRGASVREFCRAFTAAAGDARVQGVVVGWPVAKAGGKRIPREAGRVLRTLDVVAARCPGLLHAGRPVTLWEDPYDFGREEGEEDGADGLLEDFLDHLGCFERFGSEGVGEDRLRA